MNWKVFFILFLSIFSAMLGQGIVVPLLPVYAHDLGATGFQIGLIFGLFSVSRTAFLPYFGRLSDLKGRKPIITVGLLAYFLASVGFMFSTSVTALIMVRFFQGIAAAMILPVAQAYAGEISPPNKEGFIMGLMQVALYGGLGFGPVSGGILNDVFGIRSAFLGMGLTCLMGFFLSLLFLPSPEHEYVVTRGSASGAFGAILRNRHFFGLGLFRFVHTACLGTIFAFLPVIANKEFALSSTQVGVVIMLSVLISAVIMTPMGILADVISRRALLVVGGAITTYSMYYVAYVQQPWQFYVATVLIGIGGGIALPALMAMSVVIGRKEGSMGSIMSLLTISHSLGMIVGPVGIGVIIDMLNMKVSFIGLAVLMGLTTLVTWPLTSGFSAFEKS